MVVDKNPNKLNQTSQWVERLDRYDTSGTTLRSYRLKYGNSTQIAKILNNIFVSKGGTGGDTPTNQIAPGTTTAQSRLDSLDRGAKNGSTSGGSSGRTGRPAPGGPFGAAQLAARPHAAALLALFQLPR